MSGAQNIALSQRVREIDAQRYFDTLNRIEKEEAKLLVKQVEIDGMAKLGACLELLATDGQRCIVGIRDELLEWLPVRAETPVADPLEMPNRFGLVGHDQASLHEKCELVSETEMRLGIARKHPA